MFFLIRPVGLHCQLRCGYCYYKEGHAVLRDLSRPRMSLAIIRNLLDGLPTLSAPSHTLCLHGGEPLLIGKHWFEEFLSAVEQYNREHADTSNLSIAVQTNCICIDREWIQLFQRGQVGVSVSLDGPPLIHDAARRTSRGAGTHAQVVRAIELMADAGVRVGCLAVLTAFTTHIPPRHFYDYFKSLPLKNGLDISPYIETGGTPGELSARDSFEADSHVLSRYLQELFDIWLTDGDAANSVNIRMFEQLIGSALGFFPALCNLTQGASCGRTPSVLPTGEVYACDLDVNGLDFRMGSLYHDPIATICSEERLRAVHAQVLAAARRRGCNQCELLPFCGLTCPRHTFSPRDHAPFCRMMRDLVTHTKQSLENIAQGAFAQPLAVESHIHPIVAHETQTAITRPRSGSAG